MRKWIVFALSAVLCLTLAACSAEKDSGKTTDSGSQSAAAATDDSYVMTFRGTDIVPGAEMQPILDKLGEPKKYFESESCAFKGLDKVYTYDSVVIRTYPKDKTDYVLSVELKDDAVSTPEGVSIGESKDKVTKVYGEGTSSSSAAVTYRKGEAVLSFIFDEEGNVSSITYTLASQTGDDSANQ